MKLIFNIVLVTLYCNVSFSIVFSDTNLKSVISSKFPTRSSVEKSMMFHAIKGADKLASSTIIYAPKGSPTEKPASSLGIEGSTLIRAHQMALVLTDQTRADNYRRRIGAIASSLSSNDNFDDIFIRRWTDADSSNDPLGISNPYPSGHRNYRQFGLFGWGRIWDESAGSSNVYAGGYTYFYQEPNCNTQSPVGTLINRPYQEENYDTGYAAKFLIDAYVYFKSKKYSDAKTAWYDSGMRSLNSFLKKSNNAYDFATNIQATETSQHLYFNKTTGPCEKNYLILNTNMIMASGYQAGAIALSKGFIPSGSLYETNFSDVVSRVLFATNYEIDY